MGIQHGSENGQRSAPFIRLYHAPLTVQANKETNDARHGRRRGRKTILIIVRPLIPASHHQQHAVRAKTKAKECCSCWREGYMLVAEQQQETHRLRCLGRHHRQKTNNRQQPLPGLYRIYTGDPHVIIAE